MTNKIIRPRLRPFSLLGASMALACAATGAQAAQDPSAPARKTDGAAQSVRASDKAPARDTDTAAPDVYNHSSDTSHDTTLVTASPMNVLHESIGLSRMPQDAMHTPQNVNVVPQILMQHYTKRI
ncbi:hypothetical protein LDL32_01910 [Komagataeibacter sp. FNDCF1]|nr:hypothetical protein [Komagataeibacter sp. FNDCF1]MCE2563413.1 hypothetical protein [Komagataeibacter sp. FNDCF1]